MDYVLSDEELRQTMPRNEHDKICKEYQEQITSLIAPPCLSKRESKSLLAFFCILSRSDVNSPVSECLSNFPDWRIYWVWSSSAVVFNDVDRSIYYRDSKGEICEALMECIVSCGVITIEGGRRTHIDKLLPDILYGLLNMLHDDFSQESETNK